MNKVSIVVGVMTLILAITPLVSNLNAQNAITNTRENTTAVNRTELAQNASNTLGNMSASVNRTASEAGENASAAVNKTGETLGAVGKNVTEAGENILNKTGEAAQKIGAGAAGVFSNLTGEIKQGISGNTSNSSK